MADEEFHSELMQRKVLNHYWALRNDWLKINPNNMLFNTSTLPDFIINELGHYKGSYPLTGLAVFIVNLLFNLNGELPDLNSEHFITYKSREYEIIFGLLVAGSLP